MWYAIRVTYGRELKFQTMLNEAGFETFIPMRQHKSEEKGKKITKMVPAVANLCFVNCEKNDLDEFMNLLGEANPARYIWDRATSHPAIVPDKAMKDFITVCRVMADEVLYLKEITAKLREGRKVKILEGPFAGVEGIIVRIKKSRRVVVELPGMLAVATTFTNPEALELIEA